MKIKAAQVALLASLLAITATMPAQTATKREFKLNPSIQSAVDRLKIGELATTGPTPVVGTVDEGATREEYLKSLTAKDKEGIDELLASGKIANIPATAVLRILDRDEAELDKLMGSIHRLMESAVRSLEACHDRNVQRARMGIRAEDCPFDYDRLYDYNTSRMLAGVSPEAFVDSHVLVLVRMSIDGSPSKKLWVSFGELSAPSHPDPTESPKQEGH